jgi:hypothetical protein
MDTDGASMDRKLLREIQTPGGKPLFIVSAITTVTEQFYTILFKISIVYC